MTTGKVSNASISNGAPVSNSPGEGTATVKQGESNLGDISRRLGIAEQALRDANPQIKDSAVQAGQEIKLPEKKSVKAESSKHQSGPATSRTASDASNRSAEMKMKGNYVETTLRQRVETGGGSSKSGSASALNGMRLGWLKDGGEVKITRSLSPAGGHDTRTEAIAFARLTGADPAAIVKDRDGKWHAVQTDKNFYGGFRAASDNPLRQVEGLAHFDQNKLAGIQKEIDAARNKGDFDEVKRLQKSQAALSRKIAEFKF